MALLRTTASPALALAGVVTTVVAGLVPALPAAAAEREPTPAQVTAGQAAVQRLERDVAQHAAAQDGARSSLAAAAQVAAGRLEAYAIAVRAQQQATLAEQQAQDRLQAARRATTLQRAAVGSWARTTYQQGLGLGADPTLAAVLAGGGPDAGSTVAVLRHLGDGQFADLHDVEAAEARQDRLTDAAADAAQAASDAAIRATSAKDAADAALARQRDLMAAADGGLAGSRGRLLAARRRWLLGTFGTGTSAAGPWAGGGAGTGAGSGGNAVTGSVGSCRGGSVQLYGNGQIPLAALCPLAADPRQHLRADAAYAFDRLSRAYAAQFGSAPCITDSYRSYAEQVRLFATKPGLAATPGTSNHGWGTALDLCGGVQNYGTTTYRWMLVNAPLFGWFHPAWARQGAGREEPWHWEYGG